MKKTVYRSIMSEFFLVPISVFQFACCWTYFWYSAWNMAAFWFGMFAFAGIYKSVFVVRKNQKQIAEMACNDSTVKVMRDKKWKEVLVEKNMKKRQNRPKIIKI